MSDPFLGEIRFFPYTFEPRGWALLQRPDPSHLPEHGALRADRHDLRRRRPDHLALPDLRGRWPSRRARARVSVLRGRPAGGAESVTLAERGLPAHTHQMSVNGATSDSRKPANRFLGRVSDSTAYAATSNSKTLERRPDRHLRERPGAREQAAPPHPELLHRTEGIFPARD